MYQAKHIYLVFNPLLNDNRIFPSQAHEFYFNLKEKWKSGDNENAFMYWGKISVTEHCGHDVDTLNKIIRENEENGEETYLFISDFHHFWVGKLESAHLNIANMQHSLAFYDNKNVTQWFKISDFDLLASSYEETNYFLRNLFCDNEYTEQKIEGVDPYVNNIQFPLVVQTRFNDRFFRDHNFQKQTRILQTNALIETPKLVGKVKEQVKTFVLRPETFHFLSHGVRRDILNGEAYFLKDASNGVEKYSTVLRSYLNVFENVLHETYGELLITEYGDCLYLNPQEATFSDSPSEHGILLNQYKGKLGVRYLVNLFLNSKNLGNISFDKITDNYSDLYEFFQNELVPFAINFEIPEKIAKMKEQESLQLNLKEILEIRNQILGIGHQGFLNQLASLFSQYEFLVNYGIAA